MTQDKLRKVEQEVNRLLDRIKVLRTNYPDTKVGECFYSSKESGAVIRSSMDLTRALAELRKY